MANDYLFKVDMASMKESLEVRVPMLDEDLVVFGLSLPHYLKVQNKTCKRVLRTVAQRLLPKSIANKPKWGFGVPLEAWVGIDFKERLRSELLGPSSMLGEYFTPTAYRKVVNDICNSSRHRESALGAQYIRAMMLLAVQFTLARNS
jgi:asparagine synthase (glutamine-hydrolysing)